MRRNQFTTWPNTFAALPVAGALPAAPRMPLVDVFASTPPVGRKRKRFAGGSLANGGYALGDGFRLPSLMMMSVRAAAQGAAPHLIPILVCHLGAVRGGANPLARGQIAQYKDTDIAQRFNAGGYIDLDGAAQAVQELVVTGDFNVDFLQNTPGSADNAALTHLTPTQAGGTSLAPAAQPGAPGLPPPPVPFAMPLGGWPDGPISTQIANLALRTAATTRGTMLLVPVAPGGAAVPPYAGACFDNFFYGGVLLAGQGIMQLAPGLVNETCVIADVPGSVVRAPAAPPAPNVGPLWTHYNGLPPLPTGALPQKRQWAIWAPSLDPVFGGGAITNEARLVGARLLSDHLPTLVEANLP